MIIVLAALIAVAIAVPHRNALERVSPGVAIAIWLSALTLRALTGLLVVVGVLFFVPGTEVFALLTHWCWHAVLPVIAAHLGLNGHSVGDLATLGPLAVLVLSTASVHGAIASSCSTERPAVPSVGSCPGVARRCTRSRRHRWLVAREAQPTPAGSRGVSSRASRSCSYSSTGISPAACRRLSTVSGGSDGRLLSFSAGPRTSMTTA